MKQPLPADSRRSTWRAWCRRSTNVWQGMWTQGLKTPHKIWKTFVLWNYWVKYYCWASKTNWWPRFAPTNSCHSCRTTEDPKGLQKQITNPQFLWGVIKVSSVSCLPVCCLFCGSWGARCGVCDWQGKCRISMFRRNVGLDNKLVTGLPAPDVHQVWQTPETWELCVCVFIYGDTLSISWTLTSWSIWINLKERS